MKAKALIAAALLAAGTGAFAQQHDTAARNDDTRAEQKDHGATAGQKLRNGLHRLGEKTRHAFHRAGDKSRQVAHRDRDHDTHAMGAGRADRADDMDTSRRHRMDDAYANWKAKQEKNEHR